MKIENIRKEYSKLNSSYSPGFAYGIGLQAGFFSEVNLMVLAIVYCLHHKIKFNLHSGKANFKLEQGWNDYFETFCPETGGKELERLDTRERIQYKVDWTKPKRLYRLLKYEFKIYSIKRELGVNFLTFDLLDEILNRQLEHIHYDIPELGISGDLREACRVVSNIIWNINIPTKQLIENQIASLTLPAQYVGFQIRRGDKHQEIDFTDTNSYFEKALHQSLLRKAFVLTDDYGVIEDVKKRYPEWDIYTLCRPDERGYTHADFFAKSKEAIYQDTVKLMANIEILEKSQLFVGTFSANPSMFLGMIMDRNKTVSVDVPWQIWYGKEVQLESTTIR